MHIRVAAGQPWKVVHATVESHAERFTLKCNIDGIFSTFSAVISPEQVAIFNEVIKSCADLRILYLNLFLLLN